METKKKRKVTIIVVAILVLVLTLGGAYALWTYSKTLGNQTLISGDIFLKYTEGDTINIKEAMPSITYNPDEYFQFTVEGKNSYKKDVVYEIILDEGDAPTGEGNESRTERIKPELLKFRLVEIKDGKEEELIQEGNYDSIQKKRIWVDRVKANTKENIKYTYRLYMWISSDAKIGNMEGADYTAEVWNNNVYASVKVGVNGDFNEKELTEDYMILNATNESGEPYNLKEPIQSDEDITITLGSKREVTKFAVEKSEQNPISTMSLEEPTDYTASYNETTRAWEAKVTIDETGIYDYYAVYPESKGQSKEYSFTVLMNPDRFVKVEKPTSALCKQGLTYTGDAQDLIAEENLDKEGYTITQIQGTDAKSYEVKAHLKEKFRWSDSSQEDATFNCTIGPKNTILTYEPATKLNVAKGTRKTLKISAPTSGTFEVTSKASGTASVTLIPSSGTSTTVTVQGVVKGNTSLNIKFTPSNNNYTTKTDTYSIEVTEIKLLDKIKSKLDDTNSINDGETTFLSGTNDQINFNYVWYSGKLWRITAINSDNTMKMITQKELTAMWWNEKVTYQDSWVYQWLNEDFLDTLYNQENLIVQNAKWNASEGTNSNSESKLDESVIVEGNVGLLNLYEYFQSYKKLEDYRNGYLNNGYYWWLMTPWRDPSFDPSFSLLDVWDVSPIGQPVYDRIHEGWSMYGIRPSINIKFDILISDGDGTKENPYEIVGDKEVAKENDKLNSRVSGEYVNFDGKKYRIVGIENGATKLTSSDYLKDKDGSIIKKSFGSDLHWNIAVENDTDDKYFSYYLTNTWYNNINPKYKNMLVQGTYYLGEIGNSYFPKSYKNTICSEENTVETTKTCSKVSTTWKGYVGLLRYGEMFSAQLEEGKSSSSVIWLISPSINNGFSSTTSTMVVSTEGKISSYTPSDNSWNARPSINLNANVYITKGEGTEQKPYEIAM